MIFGKTNEKYINKKCNWQRWFAWYPIQLEDGRYVWLEYIERKFEYFCGLDGTEWSPFYRVLNDNT